MQTTEDDTEDGEDGHSRPTIALRDWSIEGRDMGSARTDDTRRDNAEYSCEDERNEEEESDEWGEEGGEEEEKEEEQRIKDVPAEEESKEVMTTKNVFQPPSDKLSKYRAQTVAETLQRCNDPSSQESTAFRCLLKDWLALCFNDSEEQHDAEWKQEKEKEADDISEEDRDEGESDKGADEIIFARISKDASCKSQESFHKFPAFAYDIPEGEIKASNITTNSDYLFSTKESTTLTCRAASSTFSASPTFK